MMNLPAILISALLYPGLLTALAAGALYRVVLRGGPGAPLGLAAAGSREGLMAAAGVALAGAGLACLPWPLHPVSPGAGWLWTWAAFELAFLLPLLPALASGVPALARAAIREAQLGVLARALIWAALAAALTLHSTWASAGALATHLLALAAALAAFPPAVGWGPFAAEERVTPGGVTAGLGTAGRAFDSLARDLRAGALLAALLVAGLPAGALPPALGLSLALVGVALVAALLRNFEGRVPRMTLPAALRFCLTWPAPLSLAATLALVLAGRGL